MTPSSHIVPLLQLHSLLDPAEQVTIKTSSLHSHASRLLAQHFGQADTCRLTRKHQCTASAMSLLINHEVNKTSTSVEVEPGMMSSKDWGELWDPIVVVFSLPVAIMTSSKMVAGNEVIQDGGLKRKPYQHKKCPP